MRPNFNNMNNNYDIVKMLKWLYVLSFIIQWSVISMILNLVTLGILRIPLFILFIIDALTMIKKNDKTLKKPSLILSIIWGVIEYILGRQQNQYNAYNTYNSLNNISDKLTNTYQKILDKCHNFKYAIISHRKNTKKYDIERNLNKFSEEIGGKVIVEYTEPGKKLQKKSFKYRDRLTSYIKLLESNGYKDYTKYNLDAEVTLTYLVINKNRDIIDVDNNTIKISSNSNDYKYVIDGWPKK